MHDASMIGSDHNIAGWVDSHLGGMVNFQLQDGDPIGCPHSQEEGCVRGVLVASRSVMICSQLEDGHAGASVLLPPS